MRRESLDLRGFAKHQRVDQAEDASEKQLTPLLTGRFFYWHMTGPEPGCLLGNHQRKHFGLSLAATFSLPDQLEPDLVETLSIITGHIQVN